MARSLTRGSGSELCSAPRYSHVVIFKRVGDSRPYPEHGMAPRDWASLPPRPVRLDELVTTKDTLQLATLLDEDSTFFGDLFAHVVKWRDELYLEDGLHRALRAALQQRHVRARPRARREGVLMERGARTAAVLVGAAVVLVLMAVIGMKTAFKPLPSEVSDDTAPCSASEMDYKTEVFRKEITVSVYNAGGKKGLAGDTLDRLEANNFRPGELANAPDEEPVDGVEVRTTDATSESAKLVALNLGTDVKIVQVDEDYGPGIDVFVGKGFNGDLPRNPPHSVKLAEPVGTCVNVEQ